MDAFVPSLPESLWFDFKDIDSDKCCTMYKSNFLNKVHLSNIQTCLIDPLEFKSTWNAANVAEIESLFGKLYFKLVTVLLECPKKKIGVDGYWLYICI